MVKFCRNCGKVLSGPADKTCPHCQANASKASAFCRYCGKPTEAQDLMCKSCGSAVRPTPNSIKLLNPDHVKLMKAGKIINLSVVVVMVAAYVVFVLPESVTRPIKQASSDAVMASTGYTTLPLNSIEASPPLIPELYTYYFYYTPPGIAVNSTRVFTIYAAYKNTDTDNGTRAVRLVDITANCTYQSSNESVAVVSEPGVVLATGAGAADITAFYTAPPGSANLSNAAEGKVPVTFSTKITVLVKNY